MPIITSYPFKNAPLDSGDEIIIKQTQDEYFEIPPKEGDKVRLGWAANEAVLLTGPYTVGDKSIFGV